MQALERYHQQQQADHGGYVRREYEYTRHGTTSLIAGIDVASGRLLHYQMGPTRTEMDWLAFIEQQVMALEPEEQVVFIMDQLNSKRPTNHILSAPTPRQSFALNQSKKPCAILPPPSGSF